MRTMKKSKMICAAVLTGVLGAAALAGCAQEMDDTGATYNPGEPPAHDGEPTRAATRAWAPPAASAATAAATRWRCSWRPPRRCLADHYVGGDASTHEIDGPRAECITCHPVAQE